PPSYRHAPVTVRQRRLGGAFVPQERVVQHRQRVGRVALQLRRVRLDGGVGERVAVVFQDGDFLRREAVHVGANGGNPRRGEVLAVAGAARLFRRVLVAFVAGHGAGDAPEGAAELARFIAGDQPAPPQRSRLVRD